MSIHVTRAIEESKVSLHLRDGGLAADLDEKVRTALPSSIVEFFGSVRGGILFPVQSFPGRDPHGFEVLDSTFLWSVSQLLGDPPQEDREADYFDKCLVLFSAVDDQCLLVGVDLNDAHHGWIFLSGLASGNDPRECSYYQARSFECWLEAGLRNYGREQAERWPPGNMPQLGRVGSA